MDLLDFLFMMVDAIKCMGPQICEQVGYVKNLERNFKTLKKKTNDLNGKRKDIEHEIEIGYRRNKRAKLECQNWLNNVKEIEKKIKDVSKEFEEVDKRFLKRWCFNFRSTWSISRMIVSTNNNISELITNKPSEFVVDKLPPTKEKMSTMPINKGTSIDRTLNNVLEYIQDVNVYKVGIWGMGGIGKTTLMKNLQYSSEIEGAFEIVIWITLGKDFNIQNIQNEIAEKLSITFSGKHESNENRSRILLGELRCKKFMLLMDDVWDNINFDEIGIPCNQGNGSKVVLTTRYCDVCRKMEIDHKIKVHPLSEEESWTLFHEKVGDVVDFHHIQPLAKLIVKECGGLPLALIVVGGSLRGEDTIQIWEDAVHNLSHPEKRRNIKDDMDEKVYNHLEFSFNRLESENLKNCFLYVALYPDDSLINIFELIEYWRVEGFFDSTYGLVAAQNEGHTLLRKLVDSSLFIKWDNNHVMMHDLLRDLALKITSHQNSSNEFHLIVGGNMPLDCNQWIRATRISLSRNVKRLPMNLLDQQINFPSLKTLLFRDVSFEIIIPRFFDHMESLRVLDLSGTNIKFLPPSISSLVSLVGLYLRRCLSLKTLPIEIGSLQRLEVLDLYHTHLNALPMEIRQLTRLRVLQLLLHPQNGHDMDGAMRNDIISKLQNLEQLQIYLVGNPSQFKWDNHAELVNEVCSLNRLTGLGFTFKNVECLKNFIQTSCRWKARAIKSFQWIIGRDNDGFHYFERGQSGVQVSNNVDMPWELFPPFNELRIKCDRNITSLSELGLQNLNSLTVCFFGECDAMEFVVRGSEISISNVDGLDGEKVLPILKILDLRNMTNLKSIWDGCFPTGSFACLTMLFAIDCKNLKHVLSYEVCRHLCNLKTIQIVGCFELEEVIRVDQFDEYSREHRVLLPKLKCLFLHDLPMLVVIFGGDFLPNWPSLEMIRVFGDCRQLKKLPLGLNNAPRLRWISCDKGWWDELIWSNEDIKFKLSYCLKLFT